MYAELPIPVLAITNKYIANIVKFPFIPIIEFENCNNSEDHIGSTINNGSSNRIHVQYNYEFYGPYPVTSYAI